METNKKDRLKKFSKGYIFKIILLFLLTLLLLIPLAMIRDLIGERTLTAATAEKGIMEAWGNELVAIGPVIAIPGIRTQRNITETEKEGEKVEIINYPFTLIITPHKLSIFSDYKTEIRKRGIFSVPLFSGELNLTGTFIPDSALSSLLSNEEIFLSQAELIIAISNQKGIRKINKAVWNSGHNSNLFFQPGNRGFIITSIPDKSYNEYYNSSDASSGINAAVRNFSNIESQFDISIAIQGGQLVRFLPMGQDTHIELTADWPSPSFQGAFLPSSSSISDNGFSAIWDISYLSRDIPLFWKIEKNEKSRLDFSNSYFGVDFFRAIDTYSLNYRAIKYAILFLIIPFLTLFLLEIFTKKKIHPVQYLLSGIANIIF
jgi:inner membrane protein